MNTFGPAIFANYSFNSSDVFNRVDRFRNGNMLKRVLDKSAHPRRLLRSILAVDDSPHSVALGVAIGVFVGLTPTVGIQTVLIIVLAVVFRRICYFNAPAAMASTYVSNPFTMLPMYYFWYRLGMRFLPGQEEPINLDPLMNFDGVAGWWNAMCDLGVQVGVPMFAGALVTAPFGAIASYVLILRALKSVQRNKTLTDQKSADEVNSAHDNAEARDSEAPSVTQGPHSSHQSKTQASEADRSATTLTR